MVATTRHSCPPAVLVVEDDPDVRAVLALLLAQEGYSVLEAPTGREALRLVCKHPALVDVVLLDLGLPDFGGIELCDRLRELHPRLPVVVCSGQLDLPRVVRLRELGFRHFFRKPASPEELLAALEGALSREGTAGG